MDKDAKIYVAGGQTVIGSAIRRALERSEFRNVISDPPQGLDLTREGVVDAFFAGARPEYVFLAAGRSGGILENQRYPADLMLDNLLTECHVIRSAHKYNVVKLLFLASSCLYPKHAPQPMREESLMTGPMEPTSEPYAQAKLAGITLCRAYRRQYGSHFISGIPADVFGPGDKFDPESSHVIGALLCKMHEAKRTGSENVTLWGTGTPRREFLFADDLAEACLFVMQNYHDEAPINLGGGTVVSIREVAEQLREIVGYQGDLVFDTSRPDGAPLKSLESSRLRDMGWQARIPLQEALARTYQAFLRQQETHTKALCVAGEIV